MNIPDIAVKYILFQRTEYLIYQNNRWLNSIVIRIPFLTYNRMVALESWLFRSRIKRLFAEDMEREYESIRASLPENPLAILDIGCGVAGIDVMLARHYQKLGKEVDFYLLDKTELNDKVYYGLEKTASYYNSLGVARNLLIANGVDNKRVHTQEATGDSIFPGVQFDLVLSLISWGFHYPVETYLDEVNNLLKSDGKLIIDVRKGSDGNKILEQKFNSKPVLIKEAQKHERFMIEKK
ncbi:class I SAM-dependent methyltransferase [Patescibacteria group bacterium]|nr:class I SAM-dependent methyltransferase [Patescibacteria group bacterium]